MVQENSVEKFISKKLHSLLFIEEFVFARNKFKSPEAQEIELADAVVMLGDVLIIFQIKERSKAEVVGADADKKWFETKVLKKATKQVRNTLRYLRTYDEIIVPNERGHSFNLAASSFNKVIKVVVYATDNPLPRECSKVRHYVSETAGFIHIVDARDYLELARTLRVPEEVVRYFTYRESVISGFEGACAHLPEASIAGHFVGGDSDAPPALESYRFLHRLVDDSEEWDLAPFLRRMYKSLTGGKESNDYYAILLEFAKLPRSMWKVIKERLFLSIEKVRKGEFAMPYRASDPVRKVGFVFVPADPEMNARSDWKTVQINGLKNLTLIHKYDQRLEKCIGCIISKDREFFDIQWCLIDSPWEEDEDLAKRIAESFPFREVKERFIGGYALQGDKV